MLRTRRQPLVAAPTGPPSIAAIKRQPSMRKRQESVLSQLATPSKTVFSPGLCSTLAGDAAEVPDAPEADVGLRGMRQQRLKGLHLADFDAGALLQHLAHVARA